MAALPTTSGIDEELLQITGHPQLLASKGGNPNPSYKEGYTNKEAPL